MRLRHDFRALRSKAQGFFVLVLLATLLLLSGTYLAPQFVVEAESQPGEVWSIGYWTPWGEPAVPIDAIQWDGLTHVVQWGVLVGPDGSLDLATNHVEDNAPKLIAAARQANVKVLLGVTQAYWRGQSLNFRKATASQRDRLVSEILAVVGRYDFDGVDIDWEPFTRRLDADGMTALLTDLRARLGGKALTAAAIITDSAYWGTVHQLVDRVNVMTYDMSGSHDPYVWHNSALHSDSDNVWSIRLAVDRFSARGVPLQKLGIGIGFFGWRWTGRGVNGPRSLTNGKPDLRQLAYHTFVSEITPERYRWDPVAQVPYLIFDPNPGVTPHSEGFLSYDNERSVGAKVRYARERRLGGWIIWALDQDYLPGRANPHPLMTAVHNAMKAALDVPAPQP